MQGAAPILNAFIDEQLQKYNLDDSKLALVGFSQGTMMSLYAGPRRSKQVAGILGYSGALIGAEELGGALIQKPPVCLIHGNADTIVPVSAYYHAKAALEEAQFSVSGHVLPGLAHGIDAEGLKHGAAFLSRIFA